MTEDIPKLEEITIADYCSILTTKFPKSTCVPDKVLRPLSRVHEVLAVVVVGVEGLGPLEEGGGVPELLLLLPRLLAPLITAAITVMSAGGYLTRIPQISSWLLGNAMTK